MNDLHDLAAPYALDALEPLERTRFQAHLDTCSACQGEVASFAATAERLGIAEEQAPPPELRARILTEALATPQERIASSPRVGRLRRALPRLAVAAAIGVGFAGVGAYVIEHERAQEADAQTVAMTDVLAASDATTVDQDFDNGGMVRMVTSKQENAVVVMARGLPNPGAGKVYQVWMISGDVRASHGTVTDSGTMVMEGIDTADSIAVTIEPAGGSEQPTTEPIVAIPV